MKLRSKVRPLKAGLLAGAAWSAYRWGGRVGRRPSFVLHYRIPNWGDVVNPRFVSLATGRRFCGLDIEARDLLRDHTGRTMPNVSCMGSILSHVDEGTLVWGTGLDKEVAPKRRPREIRAVRGPLTRRVLLQAGIEAPEVYGDPALLLPRILPRVAVEARYELGIVAHYKHDARDPMLRKLTEDPRCTLISMRSGGWDVVQKIRSCRRIVSTSLHGLILADAYWIPSYWIQRSRLVQGGNPFKFHDYFGSLGSEQAEPLVVDGETTVETLMDACAARPLNIDLDALWRARPIDV